MPLHSVSRYSHHVAAPPSAVFPLLCPVREYDWIDIWQGKLVYSASGFAEEDCVFTTDAPGSIGLETWVCSRYEPSSRIDYIRISAHTVMRLSLTLRPDGEGCVLTADLIVTTTTSQGEAYLAGLGAEPATAIYRPCFMTLDHFLHTGAVLPMAEAWARCALV